MCAGGRDGGLRLARFMDTTWLSLCLTPSIKEKSRQFSFSINIQFYNIHRSQIQTIRKKNNNNKICIKKMIRDYRKIVSLTNFILFSFDFSKIGLILFRK